MRSRRALCVSNGSKANRTKTERLDECLDSRGRVTKNFANPLKSNGGEYRTRYHFSKPLINLAYTM